MAGSVYVPSGLAAGLPVSGRKLRELPADGTVSGGSGDDILLGGAGRDTLLGGAGNDYLDGGAGDDLLRGGAGNDTYLVTDARDSIVEDAGGGDDWVWVQFDPPASFAPAPLDYHLPDNVENARISGPLDFLVGNDLDNTLDLTKARGHTEVQGGGGDDVILIGDAVEVLAFGGAGSNLIVGGDLGDVMIGGEDGDRLVGNRGDDVLAGNGGADRLYGGSGQDFLNGGAGDDTLAGGSGYDTLRLGSGSNLAYGGEGTNLFQHGDGDDTAFGGAGTDWFLGDTVAGGRLVAYGGSGLDRFALDGGDYDVTGYGGSGEDFLQGVSGDDLLFGGAGDDHLRSSQGIDSFFGGEGLDAVMLRQPKGDADHWVDFSMADGDYVDISHMADMATAKGQPGEGFVRLLDVRLEDGTEAVAVEVDSDGGGDHYERLLYLHDQKVVDLEGYDLFGYDPA